LDLQESNEKIEKRNRADFHEEVTVEPKVRDSVTPAAGRTDCSTVPGTGRGSALIIFP
jgi:hypothetical protein